VDPNQSSAQLSRQPYACSAQFNRGTALGNRVASNPRVAVWSPGGIVDKGHEYYDNWTHVLHRRASHCLLKTRQPEVISAVILQASFSPLILTFIADPLTPSIQSFSLFVMPERSCAVIVEFGAAIEFTHAGPISPLRRWPTPKLVFIVHQTA
jgi:hypothetical protein